MQTVYTFQGPDGKPIRFFVQDGGSARAECLTGDGGVEPLSRLMDFNWNDPQTALEKMPSASS